MRKRRIFIVRTSGAFTTAVVVILMALMVVLFAIAGALVALFWLPTEALDRWEKRRRV